MAPPRTKLLNQIEKSFFRSYIVKPQHLFNALRVAARIAAARDPDAPRVIPLCASWFLPQNNELRNGRMMFERMRIPSARFFDLDAVKDHDSPYPHMLPTAEVFAKSMQDLGIRRDDTLVVYDTYELGIFSAPRVGWTLRVFGHPKVHVLNNFRLWVDRDYPTEEGNITSASEEPSNYPVPTVNTAKVAVFAEMIEIAKDSGKKGGKGIQVLDARTKGRWEGFEPEPRPGLPSGHMPGSISIPISDLLNTKSRALLPKCKLKEIFKKKGLDPQKPIITSCGTGVTAAVIDAALEEADFGPSDRRLYDGSWTFVQPSEAMLAQANLYSREWAQRVEETDGLIQKTPPRLQNP